MIDMDRIKHGDITIDVLVSTKLFNILEPIAKQDTDEAWHMMYRIMRCCERPYIDEFADKDDRKFLKFVETTFSEGEREYILYFGGFSGYSNTEYISRGKKKGIYFYDRGISNGSFILDNSFCVKPEE